MRSRAFVLAFFVAALMALPASVLAAVSFTQNEYTLDTFTLPGSVKSEIGSSDSNFHPQTPVAVHDLNGDGKPDILVSDYEAKVIYVLLNNGSGGFSPAPGSPVETETCYLQDS